LFSPFIRLPEGKLSDFKGRVKGARKEIEGFVASEFKGLEILDLERASNSSMIQEGMK
jgi:hypothetical protein